VVEPMNRQQRRRAAKTANRQGQASQEPRISLARQAHKEGRYAEAGAIYDILLTENPRDADALHFKGLLLFQHGRSDEALVVLREAITLRRGVASFHGNLANVLFNIGDLEEAELEFHKAIRLDKNYVRAYINFSALLIQNGKLSEAETAINRALKLEPNNYEALNNLASIYLRQGRNDEAEAAFHRALTINPDYELAYAGLIFVRDFNPRLTFEEQQMDRRRWAERFINPLAPALPVQHTNTKDPERKLRIGYVSGDFRSHSAAISFSPAILERDHNAFDAYCYMTSAHRDSITEKFELSANAWRSVWGMSDAELLAQIQLDEIDILVDLAGHSAGNRLPVFGRHPAPIQISAWGYCTGTGMKAMDYIFADDIVMPPNDARHCAEEVVELSCCISFAPPQDAPDVTASPAQSNGFVTFGSLNRIEKINEQTLAAWSDILRRTPGSRLQLKNTAFDDKDSVSQMLNRIRAANIDINQVDLIGKTRWYEHLAALGNVDIALDTFPNNGGITTLETLWMGVPVVAIRGMGAASRIAASIISASGHKEWVATSEMEYVDIATKLASDVVAMAHSRSMLRSEIAERPLGNPPLYAKEVADQYRRLWRKWCDDDKSLQHRAEVKTKSEPTVNATHRALDDRNADMVIKEAMAHHNAGRFDQAIPLYDKALQLRPDDPELYHLKGVALAQTGELNSGIALIRQAIGLKDDAVDFHNNLGLFLFQAGQLEIAAESLRKAVTINPEHLSAYGNLASVLERMGREEDAIAAQQAAIKIEPENSALHGNLGLLLQKTGRRKEAADAFEVAVELAPGSPEAHNNLANMLQVTDELERAETEFKRAIDLNPNYANAYQNFGSLLIETGRTEDGIQALRRAIAIQPNHAQAFANLAAGLNIQSQHQDAAEAARRALEIAPDLADAPNNLGAALRALGDHAGAETAYRRAVALDPTHSKAHSNLIYSLDFNAAYFVRDHQAERRRWYQQHGKPLSSKIHPHSNNPTSKRRLRIGYVSADFRHHSATNGFGPMLLSHDRSEFDIICYACNFEQDNVTDRFRAVATEWRDCASMGDSELATQIREDKIDILVDLSSHSAGNRLLVFARKPAPVQVTAWGFGTGTGLPTIDYFLTDEIIAPESEHHMYAETIRFLPSHIPYMAPIPSPNIVEAPHLVNGYVTFGSFNRIEKMNDIALAAWSEILNRAPDARLIIKSQALGRETVLKEFAARMTKAGIRSDKFELLGGDPQPEHLAKHALVDIMLDPFPHGGGVSSADSLWMGVPVVALRGNTIPGRLSASVLHALGLNDFIAGGREEYIEIALRMAGNRSYLKELRSSLRDRIIASPVGNPNLYVGAVEYLYRDIWTEWCSAQENPTIS
jgi:protein O-GlcNAc transferase